MEAGAKKSTHPLVMKEFNGTSWLGDFLELESLRVLGATYIP